MRIEEYLSKISIFPFILDMKFFHLKELLTLETEVGIVQHKNVQVQLIIQAHVLNNISPEDK